MPPHKKWKDNAERQRAFQLKKLHPDYDDNQIRGLLGKTEIPPPADRTSSTIINPSAGNDGIPIPEPAEISESYAEQYLIRCASTNPGDPKVAALLIQWLDKKKALNPKIDLDESNTAITEYQTIRSDFYARHPACSDPPTD